MADREVSEAGVEVMSENAVSPVMDFMATCPKGLENLLAKELITFGVETVQESVAAVYFTASLKSAYTACVWSRLANRILHLLSRSRMDSDKELYETALALPWHDFFTPTERLKVDFSGTSDSIRDARYGAQRIKDAINDHFVGEGAERLTVDTDQPDVVIYVRLFKHRLSIGIDLVGESLHRRGYRLSGGDAPLKENLAAAILALSDWPAIASAGGTLVDPMCGSATLLLEATLIAYDIPPSYIRCGISLDDILWDITQENESKPEQESSNTNTGWAKRENKQIGSVDRSSVGESLSEVDTEDFGSWLLTRLKNFDAQCWRAVLQSAKQRVTAGLRQPKSRILGYDQNARAISIAEGNITNAQLSSFITVEKCTVHDIACESEANLDWSCGNGEVNKPGLLVVNPPYGQRLGEVDELQSLYSELGQLMKSHCVDWQASVFTGNRELGWHTGARSWRQHRLYNGSIECQLQRYRLTPNNFVDAVQDRGLKIMSLDRLKPNALMLANRIKKNQRRLQAWLKQDSARCYRIYDADLPEYAVAIDVYLAKRSDVEDAQGIAADSQQSIDSSVLYFHLQEYVAPASIDANLAQLRVKDAVAVVSALYQVPFDRISVKRRQKQKGNDQYGKLDENSPNLLVQESGYRLQVNLGQYIDTGLFLDHRGVRRALCKNIQGKRFLNLFCYTAAATVAAVKAGADASVSVDLSNTYLDWGRANLALNQADVWRHNLVRADCLEWLKTATETFDCILLDPPSFSNSKKMSATLDVQRDHVELIQLSMSRLAAGGQLYFSNNKRGFKLDKAVSEQYQVRDITQSTLDPDFQRPRPAHQCWIIETK